MANLCNWTAISKDIRSKLRELLDSCMASTEAKTLPDFNFVGKIGAIADLLSQVDGAGAGYSRRDNLRVFRLRDGRLVVFVGMSALRVQGFLRGWGEKGVESLGSLHDSFALIESE
jgi:hypothetical protein